MVFIQSCSKPKTVLVCGDHVCVNKKEARQFFEENLSLEVKIIDKKKKYKTDLVELNLKENSNGKQIEIIKKDEPVKDLKILSQEEIKQIKKNIKMKDENNKLAKEKIANKKGVLKVSSNQVSDKKSKRVSKKIINMEKKNIIDICTILDNCSIE